MAADEIKVRIATDITALKAGLVEAQAAVKQAASNMAEAQLAFGRAAEQGSEQAQAAMAEYTAALQTAEDQLDALELKQAEAGRSLARPQSSGTQFSSWREAAGGQAPAVAQGAASGPPVASTGAATAGVAELNAEETAAVAITRDLTEATALQAAANAELAASYEEAAAASASFYESLGLGPQNNNLENQAAQQAAMAEGLERQSVALAAFNKLSAESAETGALLNAEFDKATAAGLGFTEAMEAATAAVTAYDVQAEAAAASTNLFAASQEKAAGSMGLARASAMIAGREIGGGLGYQLGRVAATSSALAPILNAAFPIIAAVALGEIIYQVAEKIIEVQRQANDAAQAIQDSFNRATDSIESNVASLETQNDHLREQLDKLLGHPGQNGAVIAFDEAREAAIKLGISIDADIEKMDALIADTNKKNTIGFWGSLFTGKAETEDTRNLVQEQINKIKDVKAQYADVLESAQNRTDLAPEAQKQDLLSVQTDQLTALQKAYKSAEENITASLAKMREAQANFKETGIGQDQTANVNILAGALRNLGAEQQAIGEQFQHENLQLQVTPLQEHKGDESAANKAREKKLHDLEHGLEAEEAIYGKSAIAAAAYWDQYVNIFDQGTDQFWAIQEKLNRAHEQMGKKEPSGDLYGKLHQQAKKAIEEAKKDSEELQRVLDGFPEGERRMLQAQADQAHPALEHAHDQAQGGIDIQETKVESGAALGIIDKQQELEQLRQLHNQAYEETKQYLEKEMALYADEPKKVEEYQEQMDEANRKHMQQQLNDTTKILQQEQEKYKQVYGVITSSFNQALMQWETHEQTAAQAFAKMLNSMAIGIEELVLKELEGKLLKLLLQLVGLTDSGSSNPAQANQDALNTDRTVNPQIVESNAAAAASEVFFSSGGNLAAAAAAFAEGMIFFPLAAFEQGGVVSGMSGMPVPIMAHAGERVLSAPQTQNFERMVNQSSGGGNHFNLNYHGQVNAFDRNGMRSTLQSHAEDILDIVREGWNAGKLNR